MEELSSLGLILLLALLAGHLVKFLRVPEVAGYILAGVALGPSVLGWISEENLSALHILSEVAIGLILFSVGSVFDIRLLERTGKRLLYLTLGESLCAFLLVATLTLAFGQRWEVAFLLGAAAMATAPASTLMVIREYDARGPLSSTLLGVVAVNNILCLVVFNIVLMLTQLSTALDSGQGLLATIYASVYTLSWQVAGSVALGYLVGLLMALWSRHIVEHGEELILLAGCLLLAVGLARVLELSTLITSLAVGATMVNISPEGRGLFRTLGRTDPPLYAIFFVLAGAELQVGLVGQIGLFGILYVVGRALGKNLGAALIAAKLGFGDHVRKYLGIALLAQADLAIGLALVINKRFPELAPEITTILLAAVLVHELLGPIGVRFALFWSGEAHRGMAQPELQEG